MNNGCELTIVMPCLNEAETLATCIKKAHLGLERAGVNGEVLIADNGSTDGSIEIAEKNGARVVRVKEKGYGSALRGGIEAAQGKWVIMGDSDDSYDFSNIRGSWRNSERVTSWLWDAACRVAGGRSRLEQCRGRIAG